MASESTPAADDKKKSKEHTYLMIGLGVAGLVLGYITYRALTSGSSSAAASEVPVSTPVTTSVPSTSSGTTTSSTGSGSSSDLTSTLLNDLLAQSQSAASTAAASQTAAQQLASQQLAAAQQQNTTLLGDVVAALKGSGGSSSGVGPSSVPGASSGPSLVALSGPAAAQTAAANHQALYWIPPNSSTPEQVPLDFTTVPGDRTVYTSS